MRVGLIVQSLAASLTPLNGRELADGLGLSKSSVHRLLQGLAGSGLVRRVHDGWVLALPGHDAELEASLHQNVEPMALAARDLLHDLTSETRETTTLSTRVGLRRVYVQQVPGPQVIHIKVDMLRTYALHAGASSKAILAFLPPTLVRAVLSTALPRITEHTVTDPGSLTVDIAEIRRRGGAVTTGERWDGVTSIACPVFVASDHVVGAVSVGAPAHRVGTPELQETIFQKVAATAAAITARLEGSAA